MKRRLVAVLLTLCLLFTLSPSVSSAGTAYFVGVNSTLLPLSDDNMPLYIGVLIYVPYRVFYSAGVYGAGSSEERTLRMWRGGGVERQVDFYVATGRTVGMDNHAYEDVSARIINGIFYVPLDFICAYFGLRYNIINCEPASVIRIKSEEDNKLLNDKTFVGYYAEQMQRDYNAYFSINGTVTPQSPDIVQPPSIPPPPSYEDVTIYLSFYSLSSDYASNVLDTLAPGYRCCFFLTEDDIISDPGLIRRIAGGGHTIGLWLTDNTYSEYIRVSALLFEAVKLKTLLISSDNAQDAGLMAEENDLVFWPVSSSYGDDTASGAAVIKLPTASGSRHHLLFSCTENIADILPGVLDDLRQGNYSVARITETVMPVM